MGPYHTCPLLCRMMEDLPVPSAPDGLPVVYQCNFLAEYRAGHVTHPSHACVPLRRMVEDLFLRRLVANETALEPLADLCTAVNVWHMHSEVFLPAPKIYMPGRGMVPRHAPRPACYPFSWVLPVPLPEKKFRRARDPPEAFWSFIVNGSASFPVGWDTSDPAAYGYTITAARRKPFEGPIRLCEHCPERGIGTPVVGQGAGKRQPWEGEGQSEAGPGGSEGERAEERIGGERKGDTETQDLLLVVTTTFERAYQAAYLTRLAHVLLSVPGPLLWIVVQQGKKVRGPPVTVRGRNWEYLGTVLFSPAFYSTVLDSTVLYCAGALYLPCMQCNRGDPIGQGFLAGSSVTIYHVSRFSFFVPRET